MVEDAELESNLLQFVQKSFGFERTVGVAGQEFAVFHRTETESESKFRPKLIQLWVVLPRDWLVLDLAADALMVAPDGKPTSVRSSAPAVEAAGEKSEFREQGVLWARSALSDGSLLYLPQEMGRQLLDPKSLVALGLPTAT